MWIEISVTRGIGCLELVTPFAGVWIEIDSLLQRMEDLIKSLPSRECGLKSDGDFDITQVAMVTPFAGVWIEITSPNDARALILVTPFAGVWIEIQTFLMQQPCFSRHSLRGSVD